MMLVALKVTPETYDAYIHAAHDRARQTMDLDDVRNQYLIVDLDDKTHMIWMTDGQFLNTYKFGPEFVADRFNRIYPL